MAAGASYHNAAETGSDAMMNTIFKSILLPISVCVIISDVRDEQRESSRIIRGITVYAASRYKV
jgi:hypothetical protein